MKELKGQFVGALFVVLTVASLIAAGINFRQQLVYNLPTDGVMWVDRTAPDGHNYIVALDVKKGSSGESAGMFTALIATPFNRYSATCSAMRTPTCASRTPTSSVASPPTRATSVAGIWQSSRTLR